jgi:hypothetical protein
LEEMLLDRRKKRLSLATLISRKIAAGLDRCLFELWDFGRIWSTVGA